MPRHQLAELQLAIMRSLWRRGEATVSDVREDLAPERDLAYTTVGTMLSKMEAKGYVTHRSEGRTNVYVPSIAEDDVAKSMVGDLADRLFDGDVSEMLCTLLDERDVTPEELVRIKQLIRQKEREMNQ